MLHQENESTNTSTHTQDMLRRNKIESSSETHIFGEKTSWLMHHQHTQKHEGENLQLLHTQSRGEKLHHNKKSLEAKWRRKFTFLLHLRTDGEKDEDGAHLIPLNQFYFCLKITTHPPSLIIQLLSDTKKAHKLTHAMHKYNFYYSNTVFEIFMVRRNYF